MTWPGRRRHWTRRLLHRQTGLHHRLQAIHKQFGGLAHHIVLKDESRRNIDHLLNEWILVKPLTGHTLVKGPANRQSPPNPQLCIKCSVCCVGSSLANMFWMILWTAISTTWSLDTDRMLLIFWSSREWLERLNEYFNCTMTQVHNHLHDWKHFGEDDRSFGQVLVQHSGLCLVCRILDQCCEDG